MSKLLRRSGSGDSSTSVVDKMLRRSGSSSSTSSATSAVSAICSSCSDDFAVRRQEEKEFAAKHDSAKAGVWYIVDIRWLEAWRHFVNGRSGPPGRIDNSRLVTRESTDVRAALKAVKDYRGVNPAVWNFLQQRYGGGPVLRRRTLDLYSQPAPDPGRDANNLFAPPPSPEKRRRASKLRPVPEVPQEAVPEVPEEGVPEEANKPDVTEQASCAVLRDLDFQSQKCDMVVRSVGALHGRVGASACVRRGGA